MPEPGGARIEVWYGRPWAGRAEALRRLYLDCLQADPTAGGVCILVPTHRRAEELTWQLLAERPGRTLGPAVTTFERWTDRLWAQTGRRPPVLAPAARAVIVYELLVEARQQGRGEALWDQGVRFPGLVRRLGEWISRVKQNGIASAADLARAIRRQTGRLPERQQALVDLFDRYNRRLEEQGLADPDDRWQAVLADESVVPRLLAGSRLLAVEGFYDFSPVEQALLRQAVGCFQRTVFSIDLPDWPADGQGPEPPWAVMAPLVAFLRELGATPRRLEPQADPGVRGRVAAVPVVFGPPAASGSAAPTGLDQEIALIDAYDRREEVERIAEAVRTLLEAQSDLDPRQVAVVFPTLHRYGPLVEEFFPRYGIPYALAWSEPVGQTAVGAAVIRLLETVAGRFSRRDLVDLLSSPVVRFRPADRPFNALELDTDARQARVVGGEPDVDKAWFERLRACAEELRFSAALATDQPDDPWAAARRERLSCQADRLEAHIEALRPLLERLQGLAENLTPREFRRRLLEVCQYLGIPEQVAAGADDPALKRSVRREVFAFRAVGEAIDEMVHALEAMGRARQGRSAAEYRDLLASMLAERRVPPDPAQDGVQVLGLLEARALRFEYAWIGGLVEGELPRRRLPDIFSPAGPDRQLLYLPDPAVEDRFLLAQSVFLGRRRVWLCRARTEAGQQRPRHAIFERWRRLLAPGTPSEPAVRAPAIRTLAALQTELAAILQEPHHDRADDARWLIQAQNQAALVHGLRVNRQRQRPDFLGPYDGQIGPWPGSRRYAPGGPYVYSTTELDEYARCPFRFFALRLLRLGELPEVEEELTPLARGQLLHNILYRFYAERLERGQRVRVGDDDCEAAAARLAAIAQEVCRDVPFEDQFWLATRARLIAGLDRPPDDRPVRPGPLRRFLEQERKLPAAFQIHYLEAVFGPSGRPGDEGMVLTPDPVPLETAAGPVRLWGKVDRCDVDPGPEPRFIVYDYKSGATVDRASIVKGHRFQLPVYLLVMRRLLGRQFEAVIPCAGAYYVVKADECGIEMPLTARDNPLTGNTVRSTPWADTQEMVAFLEGTVMDRIGRIAASIAAGHFHVTPLSAEAAGCGHCPFRRICRVDYDRMASAVRSLPAAAYVPEP